MGIKTRYQRPLLSTAIAPAVLAGVLYLLQHDPSSLKLLGGPGLVALAEEVIRQKPLKIVR